jgi:hypothetical protein
MPCHDEVQATGTVQVASSTRTSQSTKHKAQSTNDQMAVEHHRRSCAELWGRGSSSSSGIKSAVMGKKGSIPAGNCDGQR